MSRYSSGVLLVVVSACAFGTMSVLARMAFATGIGVEQLMIVRFLVATALMFLIVAGRRDRIPRGRTLRDLALIGAFFYFAQSYALYSALRLIPAGLASLLLYLYPAIVALATVLLFREKIRLQSVVALAFAFAGVALTIGPVDGANPLGVVYGIASAIFYAGYIVVGARAMKGLPAIPATAVVLAATSASYALVCFLHRTPLPDRLDSWFWGGLLGLSTVLAIATFLAGLDRVGPVDASTYSAIEPAITASLAFLVLAETPAALQIVGGLIALMSVAYLAHASSKPAEAHG